MAPEHIDDGGIVVVQQKTGKELWRSKKCDRTLEEFALCAEPKGEALYPRALP
jgi:hypothetical protein